MVKRPILRGIAVAALLLTATPLAYAARVVIGIAPPAPIIEPAPPPAPVAPGYWVWRPGFWRWNGVRYVWVRGRYVRGPYAGAAWIPGHWVQRPGGWIWIRGRWRR